MIVTKPEGKDDDVIIRFVIARVGVGVSTGSSHVMNLNFILPNSGKFKVFYFWFCSLF